MENKTTPWVNPKIKEIVLSWCSMCAFPWNEGFIGPRHKCTVDVQVDKEVSDLRVRESKRVFFDGAAQPVGNKSASYDTKKDITREEYNGFQMAYDFFNVALFGGRLPGVMITLQRHSKAKGYFHADRFTSRGGDLKAHELALNPDIFLGRGDDEILSTLVHEQVHVWQKVFGSLPRAGYHDKEWAAKMREVGLQPTDTGAEGGKETGQSVTHMIVAGGSFHVAYVKLKAAGFKLSWQSSPLSKSQKSKSASKTKYSCMSCEQNAWAKPGANLICGDCEERMEAE